MHVVYLHQYFVDRRGTAPGRSYEFSRLLLERGHQVTIVTGSYEYTEQPQSTGFRVTQRWVDGIDVRTVPVFYSQVMPYWRRIVAFGMFMTGASIVASGVKDADVVYATSPPLTIAIPGIVASLYHGTPFVFEVRDLWPEAPIQMGAIRHPALKAAATLLGKVAYFCADHIVALSPGMRERIVEVGVNPNRVSVITNCSDVELMRKPELADEFWEQYPELKGRPVLLHAGAFGRINGLEYAIDLAKQLQYINPQIALVLMGRGSEKERITELARSAGVLDRNLFIYDSLPRHELGKALSAATALMTFVAPIPVLATNSANKFFDAFAAGKPVFVNCRGWQGDLLARTGAGEEIPADDTAKAAQMISARLQDKAWMEAASKASRELGDTTLNRKERVKDFERVLQDAVNSHVSKARTWWNRLIGKEFPEAVSTDVIDATGATDA